MVEQFFSLKYAERSDLFEGLSIWQEERFRALQGTYPVISLSFANIKEKTFEVTRRKICQLLVRFIFGEWKNIYNPWSVLNYLDKRNLTTNWANTSSNGFVSRLLREGSRTVKESFEQLLQGRHLSVPIDEQIVYSQLNDNEYAIWSLLVASGYLKVLDYEKFGQEGVTDAPRYELALTNHEVSIMFRNMGRFLRSKTYNIAPNVALSGSLAVNRNYNKAKLYILLI